MLHCHLTVNLVNVLLFFLVASTCGHGDIRLVGGYTDYEGRVEVCISGYWGHVCYNGWYTSTALIVCKHLFGGNISKTKLLFFVCVCVYLILFYLFFHIFQWLFLIQTCLVVVLERLCCMASAVLDHHQD